MGSAKDFTDNKVFLKNLRHKSSIKIKIKILPLEEIITELFESPEKSTVESTAMARTIQLIRSAGFDLKSKKPGRKKSILLV